MWGRVTDPNVASKALMTSLLFMAPAIVTFVLSCNLLYGGSVLNAVFNFSIENVISQVNDVSTCIQILIMWILFQWTLAVQPDLIHHFIPIYVGGKRQGARTPAGNVLSYNINGLQSWLITHFVLFLCISNGIISGKWFVERWFTFFCLANILGYVITILVYVKGLIYPSHKEDVKFSGSFIYDLTMGIEFNPRMFDIDFKLFWNGRPGIIGWTVINLLFAHYQYEVYGTVYNSMILLNILQGIYVLDFFWNERWYLHTIDICHDHFGYYLAWGDIAWLPFMYTIQGCYLAFHPFELSDLHFCAVLVLGCLGYIIFRLANHQKDHFRRALGLVGDTHCLQSMYKDMPTYIECSYKTSDGKSHKSYLLTSGFWGLARHMNYTGDIILSSTWGFCCGFSHILPHFYTIYIIILLVTRTYRDENRCQGKYGKIIWKKYCRQVPYRFIPGFI
jgi:7-dehydrocholesterol reductase